MLPNSNCKLPNIEVTELIGCMALWQYKSMLCFVSIQLPPQKWKSMSHISDPTPKKKTPKYVEQGINLNASNMCWQIGEDLTNYYLTTRSDGDVSRWNCT